MPIGEAGLPRYEELQAELAEARSELEAMYDMTPIHKKVLEKLATYEEALKKIYNYESSDSDGQGYLIDIARKALGGKDE